MIRLLDIGGQKVVFRKVTIFLGGNGTYKTSVTDALRDAVSCIKREEKLPEDLEIEFDGQIQDVFSVRDSRSGLGIDVSNNDIAEMSELFSSVPQDKIARFVAPIFFVLAMCQTGDLVCISDPELGLDEQRQVLMGMLLAQPAHDGTQMVIETLSTDIFDGVCMAVFQKMLSPEDVVLNVFSEDDDGNLHIEPVYLEENLDLLDKFKE